MATLYELRHLPPELEDSLAVAETVVGVFDTLKEAMIRAGHPDPSDWQSAEGAIGMLFINWWLYPDREYLPWTILARTA